MDWALYNQSSGYYRQAHEKILGTGGDFYTASQLQPLFGRLIASVLPNSPVLELGAGRGEMQNAFESRGYRSVGLGEPLPTSWTGTVFANEFFDALPVATGVRRGPDFYELCVRHDGDGYEWQLGEPISRERRLYVQRYYPNLEDGWRFEIAERAVMQMEEIARCLREGTLLIVDYGWSRDEYLRFPQGTLMSYREHTATSDVLALPGKQDITAHVPFDVLSDAAITNGFTVSRFETLAQLTQRALATMPDLELRDREKGQLKTLLVGLGENFRALWLDKSAAQ